jgi:hypothetical protein
MLLAAVYTSQLAEISPLRGFPDEYSAGVCDAILAYRQALAEKRLRDQEEGR